MKNSTSTVSCADLKATLVSALKVAEMGVDGLPIPGVKGCISGILKIIEQEEVSHLVSTSTTDKKPA
jgi:hypothetical protein